MRFVVRSQERKVRPDCRLFITMCALCSEDPRFCDRDPL